MIAENARGGGVALTAQDYLDRLSPLRSAQLGGRASVLVAQVPEVMKRRYNALAHRLPVLLRTNGLVQVLAFLRAKAGDKDANASAERRFAEHLGAHLQATGQVKDGARIEDVHAAAMKAPYADYLRMQEEAVACAAWHKRFSAARFGEAEED